jgi:hypothetical protein
MGRCSFRIGRAGPTVQSRTGQVKQTDKSFLMQKKKKKRVEVEWETGKEQQATGTDGYRLRHSATWADARQPRPRFFQPVGNSQMAAFRGPATGWLGGCHGYQPTNLLFRLLLLAISYSLAFHLFFFTQIANFRCMSTTFPCNGRFAFRFVHCLCKCVLGGMERHDATLPILVISSSVELASMCINRRGAGVSNNSRYQLLLPNIRHQVNLITFSPAQQKKSIAQKSIHQEETGNVV